MGVRGPPRGGLASSRAVRGETQRHSMALLLDCKFPEHSKPNSQAELHVQVISIVASVCKWERLRCTAIVGNRVPA